MKPIPQDQQTDAGNDHRECKQHSDEKRQSRFDDFVENHLANVESSEKISFVTRYQSFFKIGFKSGVIIDFYPNANRILATKTGEWANNGLHTLLNLIKCNVGFTYMRTKMQNGSFVNGYALGEILPCDWDDNHLKLIFEVINSGSNSAIFKANDGSIRHLSHKSSHINHTSNEIVFKGITH